MTTDTAPPSILDRRALSVRDILLLLGLAVGLTGIYVTMTTRLSVVEAKVDLMQKSLDRIAPR